MGIEISRQHQKPVFDVGLFFIIFSLPFLDFPGLNSSAYIKPLAIPVALLWGALAIVSRPNFFKFPIDRFSALVIIFYSWALIGALIAVQFSSIQQEIKGIYFSQRILRDMFALSIGVLFWFLLRVKLRSFGALVFAVRCLITSFFMLTFFSFFQIGSLLFENSFFGVADSFFSSLRSTQGVNYGKIFGLTPEASMLADQLLTLYMPFALASIIGKYSMFKSRVCGVKVEVLVMIGVTVQLIFTQSRIGFIAALLIIFSAVFINKFSLRALLLPLVFAFIALLLVIFAHDQFINFFNSFVSIDASIEQGVWSNVTRMGSIITGINIGVNNPFGIGTGAFPFAFEEYAPEWSLNSPEIQALLGIDYINLSNIGGFMDGGIENRLPDAKALPIRVFAELGLPGLLLLIWGWFYQIRSMWQLVKSLSEPREKYIALGCFFSLIAMILLSFSQNSYIWVHWIFISALATSLVYIKSKNQSKYSKK